MLSFFSGAEDTEAPNYGNPSSIHWAGRRAKVAMDEAREQLAHALGIPSEEEIVFTGSGTEATNAALQGAFFYAWQNSNKFHLITSLVEHEATLETANFIQAMGGIVHRLEVDRQGNLLEGALEAKLSELSRDKKNSIVVSLMAANNETGVLFPIAKIAAACENFGALLHLDAVQALGKMSRPFSLEHFPAHLISVSAHKIGGPKGVGALYLRRGLKLVSLIHGGAQERKRRAGTHNVAGIVGFGIAASELAATDAGAMAGLRDRLESGILSRVQGVSIQGAEAPRIVNTSNILFQGIRGDSLLMNLDLAGFAVSTGSACASGTVNPSHVLLAMGFDKQEASSAIRVSLGPQNTVQEVDAFLDALPAMVERIRSK